MSETSYFWSGSTLGDAANAPYDHMEFTRAYNKIFASDGAGYVIPGYANSLNVQASSPAAATIDVITGAALVKGFLYENDALLTLAISANATGNPRIDRVVLQVNFVAQTVRAVVLEGTAAASPVAPALTQTYGTLWEVSLAYIWVANGFATITDTVIHDERDMLVTAASFIQQSARANLIRGSELLPKIGMHSSGSSITLGAVWFCTGGGVGAPTPTYVTKPTQQTRGNALQVIANAGVAATIYQIISVLPSTVYTLRGLVKSVVSGNLVLDVYGYGTAGTLVSKTIHIANTFVDEIARFTTGPADTIVAVRMTVPAGQTIQFGQISLVAGYHKGSYTPVRGETIMFPFAVHDASWAFTAKSTAIVDVNMGPAGVSWGLLDPFSGIDDVSAFIFLIGANDSGSAAAANNVAALAVLPRSGINTTPAGGTQGTLSFLDLAGEVNDRRKYTTATVMAHNGESASTVNNNPGFKISTIASGAGTLDSYIGITGIIT